MVHRRPMPFGGARIFPKHAKFERMVLIDRGVQWTAPAIWELVNGSLSWIMSRIRSSCHDSSLGAMFVPLQRHRRTWSVVEHRMRCISTDYSFVTCLNFFQPLLL